ncbi:MOSC domain-containing protein [Candidatus Woesearchaeota archaeon]|nr:MOSC domain-containing protein [Candidatus Woesearchaeota archaeon]
MTASIYQINIKPLTADERGIPKMSVDSVVLRTEGVSGDYNKYRMEKKKGNLDKAVMLLPVETLNDLRKEGWPVAPGHLGENFTTIGIPYSSFKIGEIYEIGQVKIEITEPSQPCNNLSVLSYVGEEKIKDFMRTLIGRRGWYAKVLIEGKVEKGDSIEKIIYRS